MFTIFDVRGNVIGFGGRVLDTSLPKYMNSPETLVYNKGKNLYALNFAKSFSNKRILIVEGYMDAISLHQCGIINAVASLGTALTESQGRLLKMYSEEVIIAFDADNAGQSATMRGLDILDDIGCNVKVLAIPKGKDPDEFVKTYGAEGFNDLVNNSISFIEYKIKVLIIFFKTDTTEGKISFLNKTANLLSKINNNIEQEMYVKKLSKEYGISEESLYAEVLKIIKPQGKLNSFTINVDSVKKKIVAVSIEDYNERLAYYEKLILMLLCLDNSIYRFIKERISKDYFTIEINKQIAEFIIAKLEMNKGIMPADILNIIDAEYTSEFAKIIEEDCNYENNKKAFCDILKKIDKIKSEKRQQEILELLKDSEQKKEDIESLKKELNKIFMQKKDL